MYNLSHFFFKEKKYCVSVPFNTLCLQYILLTEQTFFAKSLKIRIISALLTCSSELLITKIILMSLITYMLLKIKYLDGNNICIHLS